jgi:hypothetical protein
MLSYIFHLIFHLNILLCFPGSALETTLYPQYNTDVSLDFTGGSKTLEFNLDAGFDERRRIKIRESATMVSTEQEMSVNAEAKLEVPSKVRRAQN